MQKNILLYCGHGLSWCDPIVSLLIVIDYTVRWLGKNRLVSVRHALPLYLVKWKPNEHVLYDLNTNITVQQ